MAASASILSLDDARAARRKSPETHAPSNPQFIVQHGPQPGTRRVVAYATGKPVDDTVYTDADDNAPFELRDRLNAEAEIDARLARLPREAHVLAHFESAETLELMARILKARAAGDTAGFEDLVAEFDAAYPEATAGR